MELKCSYCGKVLNLAPSTVAQRKNCSRECQYALFKIKRVGEGNKHWKGDNVQYVGLHSWVKRKIEKSPFCMSCKKYTESLDLANISQKYKRDVKDWEWLCRKCHMTKDGRLERLLERRELLRKKAREAKKLI